MRIAFVTSEYVTEKNFDGGLANYLHRVCIALVNMGHQPLVFVASDKNEIFFINGVEVHRVDVVLRSRFAIAVKKVLYILRFFNFTNWLEQSLSLNCELKKIHKEKPIDIIQYSSYAATGFFRIKNIPCVVRISSYQPSLKNASGCKKNLDDYLIEKLEARAFIHADGIFGPSFCVANLVEEVTGKKVRVIETPFFLEVIKTDNSIYEKELAGKKYLLYWGTIAEYKGIKVIAEIIYELLKKNPDIFFVFVGKDENFKNGSMVEYVKSKAGKNADRIIWLDRMNHEKLYPIVGGAYAAVLPSLVENFSNVCLEAMAHKKVVIGTDGTSFEQLLEDGKSGLLCKPGDSSDLFRAIEKVLTFKDIERMEIGEKAYLRILELAPEKVVVELVEYYKETIEKFEK